MSEPVPQIAAGLPRYRCHKEVWALKIKDRCVKTRKWPFSDPPEEDVWTDERSKREPCDPYEVIDWGVVPEDPRFAPIWLGASWVAKHNPQPGGYYVVYADGYQSYSPAKAFEEGYTLIGDSPADLVAIAERARCANILEHWTAHVGPGDGMPEPDESITDWVARVLAAKIRSGE